MCAGRSHRTARRRLLVRPRACRGGRTTARRWAAVRQALLGICWVPSDLAANVVNGAMKRAVTESPGLWKTTGEVSGGQKRGPKMRPSLKETRPLPPRGLGEATARLPGTQAQGWSPAQPDIPGRCPLPLSLLGHSHGGLGR